MVFGFLARVKENIKAKVKYLQIKPSFLLIVKWPLLTKFKPY